MDGAAVYWIENNSTFRPTTGVADDTDITESELNSPDERPRLFLEQAKPPRRGRGAWRGSSPAGIEPGRLNTC